MRIRAGFVESLRSVFLAALCVSGLACGASATKQDGGGAETIAVAAPSAAPVATPPAAPSEPSTVAAPTIPVASPALSPSQGQPVPSVAAVEMLVPATTKRTAAGLPDPLPGYQAWPLLSAGGTAPPEGSAAAHLGARQVYISTPGTAGPGKELSTPLPDLTTIVLESKTSEKDFIEAVSVMTKKSGAWQFFQYVRSSSAGAFEPAAAGAEATCAGCHQKSATDSVFSRLAPR